MFPARADDGAPVVALQVGGLGADVLLRAVDAVGEQADRGAAGGDEGLAAPLVGVLLVLQQRLADRQIGVGVVVDELDGQPIVRRQSVGGERVYRAQMIAGVLSEPLAGDVAGEAGKLRPLADAPAGQEDVAIVVAADVGGDLQPVKVPPRPGIELHRPAGGVVAVERRRRTLDHVDARIGVRIGEVGPGEAVRLGHREVVLEDLDVADAEGLPRVRAADRDRLVAGAVARGEGDARRHHQDVADVDGRRVLELRGGDRHDGLPGRPVADVGRGALHQQFANLGRLIALGGGASHGRGPGRRGRSGSVERGELPLEGLDLVGDRGAARLDRVLAQGLGVGGEWLRQGEQEGRAEGGVQGARRHAGAEIAKHEDSDQMRASPAARSRGGDEGAQMIEGGPVV